MKASTEAPWMHVRPGLRQESSGAERVADKGRGRKSRPWRARIFLQSLDQKRTSWEYCPQPPSSLPALPYDLWQLPGVYSPRQSYLFLSSIL